MVHALQLDVEQVLATRRELQRILDHPTFKASERCTKLLSYLFERALEDPGLPLKERQIGQEVFGKAADYDTGSHPIVRNAATETRKRLRMFYSEVPNPNGVRIELSPGSYLLHFTFDDDVPLQSDPGLSPIPSRSNEEKSSEAPAAPLQTQRKPASRFLVGAAILVSLLCGGVIGYEVRGNHPASEAKTVEAVGGTSFWKPVFASKKEIFISVGHANLAELASGQASPTLQQFTMTDLRAYTNLAGALEASGRSFQMRSDVTTNLDDLRDRPSILIGNLNNLWVPKLTDDLRYRPTHTGAPAALMNGIEDSHNPGVNQWEILGRSREQTVNYAIAERFRSSITGNIVVCVAGIGIFGTQAASEILTNVDFLNTLPKELEDPNKGIQIILEIPIVEGTAGRPRVITSYMW